ncbi:Type II secretion system protein G precursor [Rubripirellula amarantea]|uniref:Type II secretion system protein G n=1 Tax=Rubripirellula amarantea TaxID=2527999 RepID=A0A5C5WI76_9BACT|nr:prepilin-type N-terminal cleavage/methylation domain-containing protein [Rubripirellula amarantea]TWT50514.1 Type II secretion system protein G precursor [Rubripirellula amarantea]
MIATPPRHRRRRHRGFTLVEILVVIVIIGILMGIAIPSIGSALRTARESAIRLEIDVMSQALESYKLDHGSYPPDFSDWDAVERHFRKAFPDIDDNELRILSQFTHLNTSFQRTGDVSGAPDDPRGSSVFVHHPHAIDRAESLVFFLGGLSSDVKHPITGQGGPLAIRATATLPGDRTDHLYFQYNNDRETGFFEFDTAALSLNTYTGTGDPKEVGPLGTGSAYNYSTDEDFDETGGSGPFTANLLGIPYHADPFPVFTSGSVTRPIVYFSSRGYDNAWGNASSPWGAHSQNVYLPSGDDFTESGVARPYVTENMDTSPPSTIAGFTTTGPVFQFAEASKFQLISPGLDDHYGGIVNASTGASAGGIAVVPSGRYYNPFMAFASAGPKGASTTATDKYQDNTCLANHYSGSEVYDPGTNPHEDNITNFVIRTLQGDLP